jgi:hypothetical protein
MEDLSQAEEGAYGSKLIVRLARLSWVDKRVECNVMLRGLAESSSTNQRCFKVLKTWYHAYRVSGALGLSSSTAAAVCFRISS